MKITLNEFAGQQFIICIQYFLLLCNALQKPADPGFDMNAAV